MTRFRLLVHAVAIIAMLVLGVVPVGSDVDAAQVAPFEVTIASGAVALDGTTELDVTVVPADSGVAAVRGSFTYDATELLATGCSPLIAVIACNVSEPGLVRFGIVDPNGWSTDTTTFRVAFTAANPPATSIDLVGATEAAYETAGTVAQGSVGQGTLWPLGDVDCSDGLGLLDARAIAQFAIDARTPVASCPLAAPLTELFEPAADIDGNGSVSLLDARLVAQCAIDVVTVLCP